MKLDRNITMPGKYAILWALTQRAGPASPYCKAPD